MLEHLSSSIIHLVQSSGYFGIFILMTLESFLTPIPSEATMTFAGFLVFKGALNFPTVVIIGTIGNLIGSLMSYYLGFLFEEEVLERWIDKYGKLLLLNKEDYRASVRWFGKYGDGAIFFSRVIPGVRTFFSLPAGVFRMNTAKFIIYTTLGSAIWAGFLTYIGFTLGSKWNSLEPYFRKFELAIGVLLVLCVLWYLNHKLKIIPLKKSSK